MLQFTYDGQQQKPPSGRLRIDTHFHANVTYLSKSSRRKKARALMQAMHHLDAVCSTEHAYKDPLYAYDFLTQTNDQYGAKLQIIPGVENISSEGAEIIFLASSREHLMEIIKILPPFEWSVFDYNRINSCQAVRIVPHPFSPSKTGIVSAIGLKQALNIMRQHHYVEICNGAFLNPLFQTMPSLALRQSVLNTTQFPSQYIFEGFAGSIGSDAHKVTDLSCFGVLKDYDATVSIFENLQQRKTMHLQFSDASNTPVSDAVGTLAVSFVEYMHKRYIRLGL